MLGAGLQFNRSRNGEDRFYSTARARRSQDHLRRSQNRSQADETPEKTKKVAASPMFEPSSSCNLERFLESITPSTTLREWRTCNEECQPYFVLADLSKSFEKWSVYGAGVPLIMNDNDLVVQYYVPYLSGIQLYVDPSRSTENPRSSFNHSIEQRSYHHQTSDNARRIDPLSMRDQAYEESFSSDESESGSSRSRLLFEYLERDLPYSREQWDQPYSREPLADTIDDLARRCPELKMLRSCDLLPSSWISVAWYPIYRIPMGQTLKDLDACFLTFHSLHTPLTGSETVHTPLVSYSNEREDGVPKISLPVFGLATYKYKVSLWTTNAGYQHQLATSLLQAADNLLKLLQVNHPDYLFFSGK